MFFNCVTIKDYFYYYKEAFTFDIKSKHFVNYLSLNDVRDDNFDTRVAYK